jgi:Glycosyltransferase Family 4
MRVLLTNNTLDFRSGSELYIRDLAIELMRRGHHPVAYSMKLGVVAEELRAATVPVIESLDLLGAPPDIIHGHHHYETLTALLRFPDVPAIYYCHGWTPWQEAPFRSPRVLRYVAVDEVCRERLIAEGGVAPEKIELSLNFFDQRLFPPRAPLPSRPRQALAFGHAFAERGDLPMLRNACLRCGVELHAAGLGAGQPEAHPGTRLTRYDLVFAKARAAIEAMAAGTAVVLCSDGKLGPMVTTGNFDSLRMLNFGVRTLSRSLDSDLVVSALQQYDPDDAAEVSRLTRQRCELQPAVDRIVQLYSRVIEEGHRQGPATTIVEENRAAARYLELWGPQYKQGPELAPDRQRWIERSEAAERALGERESRLREVEDDRRRWMVRCGEAEADLLEQQRVARTLELDRLSCQDRLRDTGFFGRFIHAVARRSNTNAAPAPSAFAGAEPVSSSVQARADEMMSRHGFLGVPVETFEEAGRSQLIALLGEGLTPASKVLDIGCGCLRAACWLIRFLDPACYHGIEPARRRVEYGLRYLLTPEDLTLKQPRFDFNTRFDSSVFKVRFDFFLARSIWTHASKRQIEATLDAFMRDAASAAIFLASYLPSQSPDDDYQGDRWVGTSHESQTPGVIRHSLAWIVQQCQKRALKVKELPGIDCDGQFWLRIQRSFGGPIDHV